VLSSRGLVLAAGASASALSGLLYGVEEFVLLPVAAAVLLVLGAIWVRWRDHTMRGALRVVMTVPVPEVSAGTPTFVDMTVTNTARRRIPPLAVEDPGEHWTVSHPGLRDLRRTDTTRAGHDGGIRGRAGRAATRRVLRRVVRLADLGPDAGVTLRVPVPTARRGLLALGHIGLWCEDPFRLFARRVAVAPPAHVTVYPVPEMSVGHHPRDERVDHPNSAYRTVGSLQRGSGAVPASATLAGDELSGLRRYIPGDRLTRLHWQALARTGELMVREFVEAEPDTVVLLVDLRPSAHSGDSIERTVASAAGLGVLALQRGQCVELCTSTGDRVSVTPNVAGHHTLLRALAMLGPANAPASVALRWGDKPTEGAVWAAAHLETKTVVLVTTAEGETARALPDAIRHRAETVLVQ
jgi:uncharacterized protein (DUF58 family)